MTLHQFPGDFVWGAATSSQQIEGGRFEGGRGESIWDRFESVLGKIEDGSHSDVACDHYNRWREDVDLMQWMGLKAYRFSISWPRIQPHGTGLANPAGLDFYDALVDRLLESGIKPFPTLYHWDLPQTLQDRGGWADRRIAEDFREYAAIVARRLGDRVSHWQTHNEPWCVTTLGHEEGHHAPGHLDPPEALRVAHHLMLSHGMATKAIREEVPNAEVGIALIHCPVHSATDSEADKNAARWFDGFFNRWYLDPIYKGIYPEDAIADRVEAGHLKSPELPFVEDGDMDIISTPLDFLGFNYYNRAVMKAGKDNKPVSVSTQPPEELTDMGWEVYPEGLYDGLKRVHQEYKPGDIYITENGAAYDYPVDSEGRIADVKRIAYLRKHLLQARRAIADGIPLKGYFAWSLMDNFEWGFGYKMRFGLFGVDYQTQQRYPKDSAFWYQNVLSTNSVDDESTPEHQGEPRATDSQ
jgi:beta-glucosidase